MPRSQLALLIALLAFPALAAVEGPGVNQFIPAARATAAIKVDGKLDEPDWQRAPSFDAFVQEFPHENTPPSERTEVRVLYDDRNVYFGVYLHDSHPERINQVLGRRDAPPESDNVQIAIDSSHDHRTAYVFKVTAAGVLADSLLYQDSNGTDDWDAVWDGAATVVSDGWIAEIVVPLQILRYPAAPVQTWGFAVQRHIPRLHEDDLSFYLPLNSAGKVSRFGHLTGMADLRPLRDIEVLPYAAARTVLRPQFSDPANPEPRLWDPSFDIGMDMKAALSSNLTLNATFNPDFGQVEADQILLNLSNFETFFPEKRPFFIQGMDIFQPVGADESGFAPQMLFYSRRIGLDTPILGAAKLTGAVGPSVDVGFLDAFVAGAAAPNFDESRPNRNFRLHVEQPLHLGLEDQLPSLRPVPENFFVGVARVKVGPSATVGARVASAVPMTGTCTAADAALDESLQPPACLLAGGNAGAVDWDVRTANGEWSVQGQLAGSQVVGGLPERTLRDGTVLRRGDTGLGAYVQAGKVGGEPFRFDVAYRYAAPTLDLNATGFLRTQNEQAVAAGLHFTRPSGIGFLHRFDADLNTSLSWTTDARQLPRTRSVNLNVRGIFPGFHVLGVEAGANDPRLDVREIEGSGVPFERMPDAYLAVFGNTDPAQRLVFSGSAAVGFHPQREGGLKAGYGGSASLTWRPQDRLETRLSAGVDRTLHGPRWVDQGEADQYFFGDLRSEYLSVTLRQQLVIIPRLTLQAYAQLFTDFGRYGPYYEARSTGAPILLADLTPAHYGGEPSFHDSALNLNVVLRWEYRLGSTLYFVYTRSQQEGPYEAGVTPPAMLWPGRLFKGPATDAVLVKWSWWWSV